MSDVLLAVEDLTKTFGDNVAVDKVSFELNASEILGVVGESGSGKTTLARCIMRAIKADSGSVRFRGEHGWHDLLAMSDKELFPLRRQIQLVFQDPFASLNPRMTVQEILEEPLIIHAASMGMRTKQARRGAVRDILASVHLEQDVLTRFPHAFSGGQRQRISIARALILNPRLIVCDESVSALDVSVQAQIINLLEDLQARLGLSYLFVAHDLSLVKHICDRVLVMFRGKVVEEGEVEAVFNAPQHDYTKLLLSAIPSPDPDVRLAPIDRSTLLI
ncbi:MAG TPA: oligopeptide ABC transporter ATP-binding protein OppF [Gammaproteobacteria bacterium]|nr:oligopeptide ABC transporter ATP-binding protein OppF [Gammaproteobacteria bacterium]|tara:strand:+ start:58 stop:885 length:828 start_codon:yes stop_codon:yes gene_type:complete